MEKITNPRYYKIIIFLSIVSQSASCFSQVNTRDDEERVACDCESIAKGFVSNDGFASRESIAVWVNTTFLPLNREIEKQIPKQSSINAIKLIPVKCIGISGAVAKRCEKQKASFGGIPFLILYDADFMNKIEAKGLTNMLFVLGHEIGHLISNHYHNTIIIDTDLKNFQKINGIDDKPVIVFKDESPKVMTVRERQIEELTADAFAYWLLRKYYEDNKGKPFIESNFAPEKIVKVIPQIKKLFPIMCLESTTHPNCDLRSIFVKTLDEENNWKKIVTKKKTLSKFASDFIDSTIVILTQEQAKQMGVIVQRAREKMRGDSLKSNGIDSFKMNRFEDAKKELEASKEIYTRLVFPKDSAEVASILKEVQEILSVRSFTHFSVLGSGSYANYLLKSDGQNIDATHGYIGQLGLRLGRYSYVKPFSFEVDALYDFGGLRFDTYNSDRRALERFSATTITVQPKITYRFVGFKKDNATQGLVVSAGASWMNPIKFDYQNFQAPSQDLGLRLKPSWGGTLGIGFENINRKPSLKIWGLSRVAIVSTYQPLLFESSQPLPQNYSAAAWTVGLSASVGILPKFLIRRK